MAGWVGRLEVGETIDANAHFNGPWRNFQRLRVGAGERLTFAGTDCEYSIFVTDGGGSATVGNQARPLTTGAALTVGYRASVDVAAGEEGMEMFVTTLDVIV
jgi:hypothetical protein